MPIPRENPQIKRLERGKTMKSAFKSVWRMTWSMSLWTNISLFDRCSILFSIVLGCVPCYQGAGPVALPLCPTNAPSIRLLIASKRLGEMGHSFPISESAHDSIRCFLFHKNEKNDIMDDFPFTSLPLFQ